MAIILHLDDLLAEKGESVTSLAKAAGISRANMSNIKSGKVRAIRFSTLNAICTSLGCQPGDIIEFTPDE